MGFMIKVGTSGFSFPDWVGNIYSHDIKKGDMLVHSAYFENPNTINLMRKILLQETMTIPSPSTIWELSTINRDYSIWPLRRTIMH